MGDREVGVGVTAGAAPRYRVTSWCLSGGGGVRGGGRGRGGDQEEEEEDEDKRKSRETPVFDPEGFQKSDLNSAHVAAAKHRGRKSLLARPADTKQ